MTFLTSRREKPQNSFEDSSNKLSDKKKRRISTKAADTEAELSRYFMSAKPTSLDLRTSHRQRYQKNRRQSRDHESPQAFVDLPERPFLGFGSCGPNTSMSPAKSPVNRETTSLRCGVSRSSTPSTGHFTWSQSRGASYASPPPDRRNHVEPTKFSLSSNRKRSSTAPHDGQHSTPLHSPAHLQKTSSGAHGAAFGPSSKPGNANEAPGQNSVSPLAIGERLRLGEKSQNRSDNGIIELDVAKIPQDTKGSIPDKTHPAENATHIDLPSALSHQDQAAHLSLGHGPRCEPQAHGVRPSSARMLIKSPNQDPFDDILEVLLKDCNTNVADSYPASRASSSHCKFGVGEKTRMPLRIQESSRMPAHSLVNSVYDLGAQAPAPSSSKKPRSASHRLVSVIDNSRATDTLFSGSLNCFDRPSLGYTGGYPGGYPPSPMRNQMDSRNAWNSYDNIYEKQQEQANTMPETSMGHLPPNEAVQEDLLGWSGESDHGDGPRKQLPGNHLVKVRDGFDNYGPCPYDFLQEGNEYHDYQNVGYGEWCDQPLDIENSYNPGAPKSDVIHEGLDNGMIATKHTNDNQEKEQSFVHKVDEQEMKGQRFTTNISDTCPSWRPRHLFSIKHSFEACPTDARTQDVDSALSEFWTPHKLY